MDHDTNPPEPEEDAPPPEPALRRLTRPARRAVGALANGAGQMAEPIVGRVGQVAEPIVDRVGQVAEPIVGRVGHVLGEANRGWQERPGARVRRVRQMASRPLAYLGDAHPESRAARPVHVGLRTIDVADIAGTAVGGGDQRGGDFLPLRQARGANWAARWQRLRNAHDRLVDLPPIDVVKFADRYWVVDGHNRVALALYSGQVAIDANIVELVPPGGRRTEPIVSLAASAAESRQLRTAGSGHRPSETLDDHVPLDSRMRHGGSGDPDDSDAGASAGGEPARDHDVPPGDGPR